LGGGPHHAGKINCSALPNPNSVSKHSKKKLFEQNSFMAYIFIRGSSLLAESIRRYQLADRKRSPGRKSLFDNKMDGQVVEQYGGKILQVNTVT
jgi:hypothetical protein